MSVLIRLNYEKVFGPIDSECEAEEVLRSLGWRRFAVLAYTKPDKVQGSNRSADIIPLPKDINTSRIKELSLFVEISRERNAK